MAANISHTDVICVNEDQQSSIPSCPHGPSLLFERYDKSSKTVKKFFACSAFRDRKACNFFKWADSIKKSGDQPHKQHSGCDETHKSQRKRYFAFKKLHVSDRHICCTCGLLLLPEELSRHKSEGHVIKNKVKLKALQQPSYLFIPLDNNKTFAQYLFSKQTVDFIIEALSSRFSHLLCIGTPRIHEAIIKMKKEKKTNLRSFLLDLDQRYGQLYPPQQYTRYNMFNNHFFEKEGQNDLLKFLDYTDKKLVILVDPPFGGMVEPLALSLSKLSDMCHKSVNPENSLCSDKKSCDIPFLLFFPYFMEKRVLDSMSDVTMLDYKVEYDNHDLYKNNVKKKGSPVRIFVHTSLASLNLPADDGYWWCDVCQRYSASENWHCTDCGECTSKDGTRYVHCDLCDRCVKPSRKHCAVCNMCQLQDHICQAVVPTGCYICGEPDHKKRECPQRTKHMKNGPVKRKALDPCLKLKKKKT